MPKVTFHELPSQQFASRKKDLTFFIDKNNPFENVRDYFPTIASPFTNVSLKEARKGFVGCYSVCETMKDTKEGYFIV